MNPYSYDPDIDPTQTQFSGYNQPPGQPQQSRMMRYGQAFSGRGIPGMFAPRRTQQYGDPPQTGNPQGQQQDEKKKGLANAMLMMFGG